MSNPLDALFGLGSKTSGQSRQPLPQIRGIQIDGVLYVHAEDVADALAALAPSVNRRLIDKLRGAARR